jgi:hypothetical protein
MNDYEEFVFYHEQELRRCAEPVQPEAVLMANQPF